MKINDIILENTNSSTMSPENLDPVKAIFAKLKKPYVEPYSTTTGELAKSIKTLEKGNHTGIYFIYGKDINTGDLAYFYIGLAGRKDSSSSQNILQRFETHYYKLMVDLPTLWGGDAQQVKDEPKWQFPAGWRKGISQQFLGGQEIPNYYKPTGTTRVNSSGKVKKLVTADNLDFVPKFVRDPMDLPMLIWNLDDFSYKEIEYTETSMIRAYRPLFNTLTGKYDQEPTVPDNSAIMSQPAIQKNLKKAKQATNTSPKIKQNTDAQQKIIQQLKSPGTPLNVALLAIKDPLERSEAEEEALGSIADGKTQEQVLARLKLWLTESK